MLAILTSHPIQYQAPLWRLLAQETDIPFEVWFLSHRGVERYYDKEFRNTLSWDIDLLGGYSHRRLLTPHDDLAGFFSTRISESLNALFQDREITHIWIEGWRFLAFWQAARAASASGIKVWLRGETNDLTPAQYPKDWLRRPLLRYFFQHVDAFLAIGSANRRFYQSLGVAPNQIHSAPYCIDNFRFSSTRPKLPHSQQPYRSEWNIPDRAYCFLFAGKLIEKKHPADVILAIKKLLSRHTPPDTPIHLLVVGSGPIEQTLKALAVELPVTFTGFINQQEMALAYQVADCLILPSDHRETWGLVANEAMASGIPCIASDRCGCAEDLINPVDPRLVYPCGNCEALADAMNTAITSPPPQEAVFSSIQRHHPSQTLKTVQYLWNHSHHP